MSQLIFFCYAFFVVTLISGSFGTAVWISFAALLSLLSVADCLLFKRSVISRLCSFEICSCALFFWLILTTVSQNQSVTGFLWLVEEYRFLILIPVVSSTLASRCNFAQVVNPILLGLAINLIGSLGLIFEFESFDLLNQITGEKVEPKTLDGKFLQAILVILVSPFVALYLVGGIPNQSISKRIFCATLYAIFTYHAIFVADSRSAAFGMLFSLILVFGILIFRSKKRFVGYFSLTLFATVILFIGAENPRLKVVHTQVNNFIEKNKNAYTTSVGQRLLVWKSASEVAASKLVFGHGAGDIDGLFKDWYLNKKISKWYFDWRDFHSEFIWLFLIGGFLAVLCYLSIVIALWYESNRFFDLGQPLLFSLGISLIVLLGMYGVFNSIQTVLREKHLFFMIAIFYAALAKQCTMSARLRGSKN